MRDQLLTSSSGRGKLTLKLKCSFTGCNVTMKATMINVISNNEGGKSFEFDVSIATPPNRQHCHKRGGTNCRGKWIHDPYDPKFIYKRTKGVLEKILDEGKIETRCNFTDLPKEKRPPNVLLYISDQPFSIMTEHSSSQV